MLHLLSGIVNKTCHLFFAASDIFRRHRIRYNARMGEAKRKKMQQRSGPDVQASVGRVASAVRRLASAASRHYGGDCYLHAVMGQQLLADLGIPSSVTVGYAAWRIGPGDGDVISHTPHTQGYLPEGAIGLAFHAWLECQGLIVDLTTYQFAKKAQDLDAADGGHTTVAWRPDYLMLPHRAVRTYHQVAQALGPGVAYYEAVPSLRSRIGGASQLDPEDIAYARLLLANPELNVLGPNQLG